jgi:hypothetical protein
VLADDEYERRFVDAVRERIPLGPGRRLVDIRTRGALRRSEINVLFRDDRLPNCIICFAKPLWGWAEDESGGADPEGDADMYLYNTWYEFPPIPSPEICAPDGDGITWVTQPR